MLIAQKQEPFTLMVMGASFTFAPITRPMMMRARRAGAATVGDEGPDLDDFGNAVSLALLMEGITAWDGVTLPIADGEEAEAVLEEDGVRYRALACTPENKALLLEDSIIFDALDAAYVGPFVMRERAKNVQAGSLNGTSTRATPATITAAQRAETTGSGKTRRGKSGAKSARTSRTKSKTPTSN